MLTPQRLHMLTVDPSAAVRALLFERSCRHAGFSGAEPSGAITIFRGPSTIRRRRLCLTRLTSKRMSGGAKIARSAIPTIHSKIALSPGSTAAPYSSRSRISMRPRSPLRRRRRLARWRRIGTVATAASMRKMIRYAMAWRAFMFRAWVKSADQSTAADEPPSSALFRPERARPRRDRRDGGRHPVICGTAGLQRRLSTHCRHWPHRRC
jgi:hypothetical protein